MALKTMGISLTFIDFSGKGQIFIRYFPFYFSPFFQRDDCLKALNLVSMEDAVKFRRLSLLFWCLCVVDRALSCRRRTWSIGKLGLISSLPPHERGFKRQTLYQWRGSENCCDEVAQRTVNRILRGWDTCSYSKMEQYFWEKWWLCWEVGM